MLLFPLGTASGHFDRSIGKRSRRMMSERIWAIVGRVGTIIGLVGGLILIVQYLTAPTAKVVAEVRFSSIIWPPNLEKEVENLYRLSEPERIKSGLVKSEKGGPQPAWLDKAVPLFSEYLRLHMPRRLSREYPRINGM